MQKQLIKIFFLIAIFFFAPLLAKAGTTNITDCGYLGVSDETYVLQNDVSSNGSCFAIIANNVTLDLNGYTATYDDGAPLIIPNGNFESGDGISADNWDMTQASNIQRSAGTFVKPVTLFSGNYALKLSVPSTDQQIRSIGQVTLEPNTTYSISGMFLNNYYNGGYQSDNITLFVGLDDGTTDKTASHRGINWRGFQYTYKSFTTGSTAESYNVIVGISGASSAAIGNVYIDDIKIQKHRVSGVFIGPANWKTSRYPDITSYGNAINAVIKNGKILQGNGGSDYADAIYIEETSGTGFDINNLEITTRGANAYSIFSYNMVNGKIYNNLIHSEIAAITSRDGFNGAVIKIEYGGDGGLIYDNVIDKGVQTAVYASTKANALNKMQVHGNNITLQSRYTNDFAIVSGGSKIFSNTINCGDGENSCRGIAVGGNGTEVYNNIVNVQQLLRNQEYNGCEASGAYGMQMESNTHNLQVYGNTVTANAGVCEAYAFRANPYAEGGVESSNNAVYNNLFIAIANSIARAATIKYSRLDNDDVNFYGNTMRTNHRWIYNDGGGEVVNPTFIGNRWETVDPLPDPFRPFEVYNSASFFSGTFYDNTYRDLEDKVRFESEFFRTSNGNIDLSSNFTVVASDIFAPIAPAGLSVM